jgi:hypothetical protein
LFVIARNSSFTYKGRAVDVREIGRDLGVRYVLEGSLRKSGNHIRVTAQLIEAESGKRRQGGIGLARGACFQEMLPTSGTARCMLEPSRTAYSPLSARARARAREATGNQKPWPADKVERWAIDGALNSRRRFE